MKNILLKSSLLISLLLLNSWVFADCPAPQNLKYDKNNGSYSGLDSDKIIWQTAPAVPFKYYPRLSLIQVEASNYGGNDNEMVSRIVCIYSSTEEPFTLIHLIPPGYPDGQSYDIIFSKGEWVETSDHVMNRFNCNGADLDPQSCPFVES